MKYEKILIEYLIYVTVVKLRCDSFYPITS